MQDTDATRRPPFFCPYTNRDPDQKKRILSCPWGACVACRAGVAGALHHGVPRQWLSHGMPASLCATLASLRVLPCLAVPSSRSVVAVSCRCCPAWQRGQPCPRGALSTPGCNDPAEPAQFRPLKRKLRRGSSCSVPDVGAAGCRTVSSPPAHDWRAAGIRTGAGGHTAP